MSKFAEVIKNLGVTEEELVGVSRRLEKRGTEDRALACLRITAVRAGKKTVESGVAKPRLGRALTAQSVKNALAGLPQTRVVRAKLLRAVNDYAQRKQKAPLTALELFGEAKKRVGKKVEKKKAA